VTVTKVDLSSRPFSVWVEGEEAKAPDALASTLIVATGASPRRLEAAGAEAYWQRGVSTCATCDGYFFKGKVAAVIGGGDSACEEALYLAKLCTKVFLVHRRSALRASKVMADRALAHPKIEPVWDAVVREVRGDGRKVTSLLLGDATGAGAPDREIETSGVFVAIGHVPATAFLGGQLETDAEGYLKVDAAGATSVTGVWAAGDVADRKYRQAIVAAGNGCVAALECERWLTMNEPPSA
jgi:thioredoxin reductase (NADPH)